MSVIRILGLNVHQTTLQEVVKQINQWIGSSGQHYIVTPNPEFLVAAHHDQRFAEILNQADIAIPDGVGLILAARFLGQKLHRITGVDLVKTMAQEAAKTGWRIFLLGAGKGIAEKAAQTLHQQNPGITIVGATSGGVIKLHENNPELIATINQAQPDILLVAFGHPKQEYWIANNLAQLPTVKVAIGVGGTFDYISGVIPRAPKFLRQCGLEWLYRLIKQPTRWRRIADATIIFPWLIAKSLFKKA